MISLYKIDQEILACLDDETGEVMDCERLEELCIERENKIEGIALWVKTLLAEADAIKAEKNALAEREADCRKKAEKLKEWLANALGGEKFETARCAISFRKSSKLEVYDIDSVPCDMYKVEYKVDVAAAKAKIKAGGYVPGCKIVDSQNIQIK